MQSPSNSQAKAINHGEGPMLVLAGPGSGKTFVIVQRILNLIHEKQVRPDQILVISFSKASTIELKNRFETNEKEYFFHNNQYREYLKIKETQPSNFEITNSQVNFATFHACFFHILKDTYRYTSKDIITEKEKREILKSILLDPAYEQETKISNEKIEDYLQKISFYKNKDTKDMKEKETIQFQNIFHSYNREIHSRHKLDFDDMGLLCLQLFRSAPDILHKWQNKFQYILIDEFQDINMVQFSIVHMLSKQHENLFVVGDDDQSIYSFRGANPQIMLDFEKYYPEAQKVLLEINYRCSEEIVKEALQVIEENKVRFHKEITAFHRSSASKIPENGNDRNNPIFYKNAEKKWKENQNVVYTCFENNQKEYLYIGEKIRQIMKETEISYSEIACIFRTNQDMRGLAEAFSRNKIPFVMKESCQSIFQHFIALDLLAYLKFFYKGKKRRDFIRVMNKPLRYLSRNALSASNHEVIKWTDLKNYYHSKNYMISMIEQLEQNEIWLNKLDLYGACFYIRKVMGYEQYLKEYCKEQNFNWEEAVEILDFVQESTREMSSFEEWSTYIEQYEEQIKTSKEEKNGVHLITMHACKGLEYTAVFLPDCNEGKIPHKKAAFPEEIEEERRMFYVAMTRAKAHLEILCIKDRAKKYLGPSRFIKE